VALSSGLLLGGGGGNQRGSSEGLGGAGGGSESMSGGGIVRMMTGVAGLLYAGVADLECVTDMRERDRGGLERLLEPVDSFLPPDFFVVALSRKAGSDPRDFLLFPPISTS
jgi:hypothetical protein